MLLNPWTLASIASLIGVSTAHSPAGYHTPDHSNAWKTLNNPQIHHINSTAFTITTPPATDIWRPNITADNFTAPYLYKVCKSSSFKSISVTLSANWKTRYDQGGIAIFFPSTSPSQHHHSKEPMKWVKSGIEFESGAPQFGTVGTYAFSDWSLAPVRPEGATQGSFLVERNTTEMWVYAVVEGERQALREVTWAFLEDRGREEAEIWVGVYAAKPTYVGGHPKEGLEVTFTDLEVEC